MGVSTISSKVAREASSISCSATHFTKCFTRVLGDAGIHTVHRHVIAVEVAHPKASSERSPVPITIPQVWLAISIRIWVRSRACAFLVNHVVHMDVMVYILEMLYAGLLDTDFADGHTEGIHQVNGIRMSAVGRPEARHSDADDALAGPSQLIEVFTQTSNASVESSPPEMPITALFALVCTSRCASPGT